VVLDIKFENLSSQVSSTFLAMPDEQAKAALDSIPVTDNMLVLALASSKAAARTIASISDAAKTKGFAPITVDVPAKAAGALRANLASIANATPAVGDPQQAAAAAIPSINRIDYQSLEDRIKKFQSAVVVSQAGFDPLFGFSGAPTALVRALLPEKMAEAFLARKGNVPAPGEQGEPLKIAVSSVQNISAITSVELVANGAGIAGVHTGTVHEAFSKAAEQLKAVATVEADPVRSAVISAGSEAGTHATLAGALYSLWNAVHIVRDGGSAVLLAECREGIGGGALQAFVEGRLKPEQLAAAQYIDGLEHLLYMQELKQKCELGLVSSLPHYYADTKLGLATYAGARDALEKLLVRNGKGHKALVVSDADITLLKPRD
jgi:hypothetical protein